MLRPDHLAVNQRATEFTEKHILVRTQCPHGHISLASILRHEYRPGLKLESQCLGFSDGQVEACEEYRSVVGVAT